jgi:hypothetical protein
MDTTMEHAADEAMHDAQARAVTQAVVNINAEAPDTFPPNAVFDGAVRGGAVVLLAKTRATPADVASLLEAIAAEFRQLEPPARLALVVDNSGKPN